MGCLSVVRRFWRKPPPPRPAEGDSSSQESWQDKSDKPDTPLHIVIIGAGLAGLSTAISTKLANPEHKVTVLEAVKELAEVGVSSSRPSLLHHHIKIGMKPPLTRRPPHQAGFQITPNSTRIFKHWSIFEHLAPHATHPESITVRRYDGTKVLSHIPNLQASMQARYDNPYWGLHRVDLQRTMVARAKELGAEILLDHRVADVDFDAPAAILENGKRILADVLMCGDGLWSPIRSRFLGRPSPALETGDLAYRMLFKTSELRDPELRAFVESRGVTFWIGPGAHCVGYNLRDADMYNLVLLNKDDLPPHVTKQDTDTDEMKAIFSAWDPLLQRFLDAVDTKVLKWRLGWLEPLAQWTNDAGTFVMAGDACHPMLPYLAQGANSSVEDGAVLGWLMGRCRGKGDLRAMARMYEVVRKERGERIARETFGQRDAWHMGNGAEQERRDEELMRGPVGDVGDEKAEAYPSRW